MSMQLLNRQFLRTLYKDYLRPKGVFQQEIELISLETGKQCKFIWSMTGGSLIVEEQYAEMGHFARPGRATTVRRHVGEVLKRRVHVFLLKLNKDNQESLWLRVG